MGVDAVIGFMLSDPLSDRELAHLQGRLNATMRTADTRPDLTIRPEDGPGRYAFFLPKVEGFTRYEVENPWRYYGQNYERGPWPQIRATLVWLMRNVGNAYYGADCWDDTRQVTREDLDKIDEVWATAGHAPYDSVFAIHGASVCPTCAIPMRVAAMGPGPITDFKCEGCGLKRTVKREATK